MTTLDHATAERLAKLCGLLGSDHAGERSTAAAKADALLRAHGLMWGDIISRLPSADSTIADKIKLAFSHYADLSLWERGFLLGIKGKQTLSEKQLLVLDQVIEKLGGVS
jgi:hypothetical protein